MEPMYHKRRFFVIIAIIAIYVQLKWNPSNKGIIEFGISYIDWLQQTK